MGVIVSRNRSYQRYSTTNPSPRLRLTYTAACETTLSAQAYGRTKGLRCYKKETSALRCQHAGRIPIDESEVLEGQVLATLPALSVCSMAPMCIDLWCAKTEYRVDVSDLQYRQVQRYFSTALSSYTRDKSMRCRGICSLRCIHASNGGGWRPCLHNIFSTTADETDTYQGLSHPLPFAD